MINKSLIASGSFGSNKLDTQWDERQARFSEVLLVRGGVAGKHDFFRNWVRGFIGFGQAVEVGLSEAISRL